MALEERYINMRRGGPAGPQAPAKRQAPPRQPAPSQRPAAVRREPQRQRRPAKRRPLPRRSPGAAVALGLYKGLVMVSAIIVAVYIGLQLIAKPPERGEIPQQRPSQAGQAGNSGGAGPPAAVDGSGEDEDKLPPLELRDGVYNILLAAADAEGFRTDTMMVMSYDTKAQKVGVVSIPRDTITRREKGNPKLVYGKGGVEQRMEDISQMLGIPIDGYVKVKIKGFITLVDYLGGVDIEVPVDMNYDDPTPGQDLHIHFKKGYQHLNGQQAMEVARYRHDNNNPDGSPGPNQDYTDVGRTRTQQEILKALAKKVLSWDNITKIGGFVEIFNKNVDTDLTLNEMMWFAQQALGLDLSTGVETTTLEGRGDANYRGYSWCFELDHEKALETVNSLLNPYTRALTLEEMDLVKADSYYFKS